MIQQFLKFYFSTTFIFLVQYFLGTAPFVAVLPRKEGLGLRLALWLPLFVAESLVLAAVFNDTPGYDGRELSVCLHRSSSIWGY